MVVGFLRSSVRWFLFGHLVVIGASRSLQFEMASFASLRNSVKNLEADWFEPRVYPDVYGVQIVEIVLKIRASSLAVSVSMMSARLSSIQVKIMRGVGLSLCPIRCFDQNLFCHWRNSLTDVLYCSFCGLKMAAFFAGLAIVAPLLRSLC